MRGMNWNNQKRPLCPGCYMVVLYNAALTLAKLNGQDTRELGATMAQAFARMANGDSEGIESIDVAWSDEPRIGGVQP
jgi:hypothetical protein